MQLKNILRNVIKATAVSFAVGAVLSLALPSMAAALGMPSSIVGSMGNPMWSGAFFGAWAAINAVIEPAMQFAFGQKEPKHDTKLVILKAKGAEPAREEGKAVNVILVKTASRGHHRDTSAIANYQQKIQDERATVATEGLSRN